MINPTPLDQALARLQDGEKRAFDEVFDSLWPVLVRYARARLGGEADAEETAQRVLVRLFENVADYDRERPALGWAFSTAYWECRTERKRARRHAERHVYREGDERSDTDSPEEQLDRKEHLNAFHQVWQGLSDAERRVLLGEQRLDDEQLTPAALRKRKQRIFQRLTQTIQTILGKETEQ